MAFPVPRTLSPSKVSSFTDCALAFRFSAIDRLPEPPTVGGHQGHAGPRRARAPALPGPRRAHARGRRSPASTTAVVALRDDPEYVALGLDDEAAAAFQAEAADLVRNYFRLEDPTTVRAIGLELQVEAEIDGIRLRGIIDRLELDADGELVVTDYKTGAAPSTQHERKRLSGVHIYSLLCEQLLGRRPSTVQLLYLQAAARHHHRAHRPVDPGHPAHARAPCGRRSSGPASARTSGPSRRACATTAPSRPTARPSAATRRGPPPAEQLAAERAAADAAPAPSRPRPCPAYGRARRRHASCDAAGRGVRHPHRR